MNAMPSTLTGCRLVGSPHKQLVLMVTVLFGRDVMHDKTELNVTQAVLLVLPVH